MRFFVINTNGNEYVKIKVFWRGYFLDAIIKQKKMHYGYN
jgi:hypothetical protein